MSENFPWLPGLIRNRGWGAPQKERYTIERNYLNDLISRALVSKDAREGGGVHRVTQTQSR